jgi:hypothetical protein
MLREAGGSTDGDLSWRVEMAIAFIKAEFEAALGPWRAFTS